MITRIMQGAFAKGLPTFGEIQQLESAIEYKKLEKYEGRGKEAEKICRPSTFGGTSEY